MSLPILSEEPEYYPDCCASISHRLLEILTENFQNIEGERLILSIGSGTGLLEALLLSHLPSSSNLTIEGVEVDSSINKYLPEQNSSIVRGTWELSPHLNHVGGLMFVYPRSPELVKRYFENGMRVEVVVGVLHRSDWTDFQESFGREGWEVEVLEGGEGGVVGNEMVVVFRKGKGKVVG
ncbi:hypothetical protein B0O99DRAFT_681865 [Bisporella sp. PMI_857]|nr:hypothetical protein B0O99DRAFT_681865 [Bisporella sp. PMI_857]